MDKVDAVSLVLGLKILTSTRLSSSVTHLSQRGPGPDGTVLCLAWHAGIAEVTGQVPCWKEEQKVQNGLCPVGEDRGSDRMQQVQKARHN